MIYLSGNENAISKREKRYKINELLHENAKTKVCS